MTASILQLRHQRLEEERVRTVRVLRSMADSVEHARVEQVSEFLLHGSDALAAVESTAVRILGPPLTAHDPWDASPNHRRARPARVAGGWAAAPAAAQHPKTYCTTCPRDSHGRIKRSSSARRQFLKSKGLTHTPKGCQVDHIVPLAKGSSRTTRATAAVDRLDDPTDATIRNPRATRDVVGQG